MKKDSPIENRIYASIIGECEFLESKGVYKGNGHHLAQRLTRIISAGLLSGQQKHLFSFLTTDPMPTKEISNLSMVESKNVSSQLQQIYESTLLIGFTQKGKLKYWYKK